MKAWSATARRPYHTDQRLLQWTSQQPFFFFRFFLRRFWLWWWCAMCRSSVAALGDVADISVGKIQRELMRSLTIIQQNRNGEGRIVDHLLQVTACDPVQGVQM